MISMKYDENEFCFGKKKNFCLACREIDEYCETPKCPIFKPAGCQDWLRADYSDHVEFISPENLDYTGMEQWLRR